MFGLLALVSLALVVWVQFVYPMVVPSQPPPVPIGSVDQASVSSQYIPELSVFSKHPPNTIADVFVTAEPGRMTVFWTSDCGSTGQYVIYRKTLKSAYGEIYRYRKDPARQSAIGNCQYRFSDTKVEKRQVYAYAVANSLDGLESQKTEAAPITSQ